MRVTQRVGLRLRCFWRHKLMSNDRLWRQCEDAAQQRRVCRLREAVQIDAQKDALLHQVAAVRVKCRAKEAVGGPRARLTRAKGLAAEEKRDVRRDGEMMPNLEALNGTPSQTNMPSATTAKAINRKMRPSSLKRIMRGSGCDDLNQCDDISISGWVGTLRITGLLALAGAVG